MQKLMVSVDLDDLWLIQPNSETILPEAIKNSLELFKAAGIRATYFCIAKDVDVLQRFVPEILSRGHEIANHSFSHRYFQLLSIDEKEAEITKSDNILRGLTGSPISGFRSPGWGLDATALDILKKKEYLYDASLAVSWLFPILRLYHSFRAKKRTYIYGNIRENLGFHREFIIPEVPLLPSMSLPFYGSFNLYFPFGYYLFFLQNLLCKRPLSYIFHASDFIESSDGFLSHHKRHSSRLEKILEKLVERRDSITIAEYVQSNS